MPHKMATACAPISDFSLLVELLDVLFSLEGPGVHQ